MEIFQINNNVHISKCLECEEISLLTIDKNEYNIISYCKNGHYNIIKNIYGYKWDLFKNSMSINNYCSNCFHNILEKNDNYECLVCNKLLCNECIYYHIKVQRHNKFKLFFNKNILCSLHDLKFIYFCNDCKTNICNECTKLHIGHTVYSLLNLIPNNRKKEEMKSNIKINKNKINNLINYLEDTKKNIINRFNKIKDFLSFLNIINSELLENFNFSCYNYYNYKNYNYFYDYLSNIDNLKPKKFLNYIFYENKLNEENEQNINQLIKSDNILNNTKSNINSKQTTNNNEFGLNSIDNNQKNKSEFYKINIDTKQKIKAEFCNINNMNKLIYFKDNIFISYIQEVERLEKKKNFVITINLYEYNNFSFRHLSDYIFNSSNKIKCIKVSKYFNQIFINFETYKKIIILEYNPIEKKLLPTNKEIRCLKKYKQYFIDIIDNKNENIITVDSNELIIWKKNNKNIRYDKICSVVNSYYELMNINDSLFICKGGNTNISFYETENYQLVKHFYYNNEIKLMGTIQNKIFLFKKQENNYIYLVDLKYFEIIQILHINEDIDDIILLNDYLLEINAKYGINEIKLKKQIFNFGKGEFISDEIITLKINYFSYDTILTTENNSIVFIGNWDLVLIKF